MKEFTIKDLMKYNSPCKSCGAKTKFYLRTAPKDQISAGSPLAPIQHKGLIAFNLVRKYQNWINLIINPTNHNFAIESNSNNPSKYFLNHLENNTLEAESQCLKCNTLITSNFLEFNISTIKPLTLYAEFIQVKTSKNEYSIVTDFNKGKSLVTVGILNNMTSATPITMDIPAIPLFKFKDKEALLAKLKLLVTFS